MGHVDVLQALKALWADLNKPNHDGATPAHIAAQEGRVAVIQALKDLGADLDKPMPDGATPAFIAARWGQVAVLQVLGELGADLDKPRKDGATPAYIAAQEGRVEVVAFLLKNHPMSCKLASFSTMPDGLRHDTSSGDIAVKQRVNEFISNWKGPQPMMLSPYDIAKIMGHQEVMALLSQFASSIRCF